jgi:hypothetical protein
MAEHLICDSYLFKFKNKRTNIGKKDRDNISSKEQEIRRTKNKQTHKNGEQKFKLAGSKNVDI